MFAHNRLPYRRWVHLARAVGFAVLTLVGLVRVIGHTRHVRAEAAHLDQVQHVVCPAGPPSCDFADLQRAIDAAAPGDEIFILSGVYSGNITLRSRLTIRGETADPPVLTAGRAPIVAGAGITATALAHVVIDGRGEISTGMVLTNVDVSLEHVSIVNVHGRDAVSALEDGDDAVAIQLAGQGRLTARSLAINSVRGGNGFSEYYRERYVSVGGGAVAVAASGFYSLTLRDLRVVQVYGGDAGDGSWTPYGCSTSGGDALGISMSRGEVLLEDAHFRDFRGGAPCNMDVGYYCREFAGIHSAIQMSGGRLTAHGVSISEFFSTVAHHPRKNTGIDIANLDRAILERITVESMKGFVNRYDDADRDDDDTVSAGFDPETIDAAFCYPTTLDVVGVSIDDVDDLFVNDLTVRTLHGAGYGSTTRGVDISHASQVIFLHSLIDDVIGGHVTHQTDGLRVNNVESFHMSGVDVRNIRGGDGPDIFDSYFSGTGGSAAGITLQSVRAGIFTGNSIWNVVGGNGMYRYSCWSEEVCQPPRRDRGGDAIGVYLFDAEVTMSLNTIYNTAPGLPSLPENEEPRGIGVAATALDASITGSIIGQHQTGILVSTGSLRMFGNDYWQNDIDAVGVPDDSLPWYEDPQFVDADGGDLHLAASSPLIGGYAYDVHSQQPVLDIDGTVREEEEPPKNDIGADEFDRGPLVTDVRVTPEAVTAGAFVTVTSTFVDSSTNGPREITATTTWGYSAVLVPDSLASNYGEVEVVDGLTGQRVIWRGQPTTDDGDVPSSRRVEVRFVLQVLPGEDTLMGRVTTRIFDPLAEYTPKAEAEFLINPHRLWLPLVVQ